MISEPLRVSTVGLLPHLTGKPHILKLKPNSVWAPMPQLASNAEEDAHSQGIDVNHRSSRRETSESSRPSRILMNPGTKILHGVDVSDFSCVAWRWCPDWLEP
jgi:hypothetical protein